VKTGLESLRVLVIDDSRLTRELIQGALAAVGVRQILCERDGESGLAALARFRPDIVFLDWEMEPMNGIAVLHLIRTGHAPDPYVPVIMVTAHAGREAVIEARDAGITEFLAKPITVPSLLARLHGVIRQPRHFVLTPTYRGPDRRRRHEPKPAVAEAG
jgi:two-component system chemotaxis response regulator CheY